MALRYRITGITSSGSISPGRKGDAVRDRARMFEAISNLFRDCDFDFDELYRRGTMGMESISSFLQELYRSLSDDCVEDARERFFDLVKELENLHLGFFVPREELIVDALLGGDFVLGNRLIGELERKNKLYLDLLNSQRDAFAQAEPKIANSS